MACHRCPLLLISLLKMYVQSQTQKVSNHIPLHVVVNSTLISIDWFKGKITGKPYIPWENL